eukprot:GDKI01015994.1.p1 GENE.GDKI01015994.1~~GDKI01015994.1.p1  ORF type:complete len:107 (+),score=34.71 GDKI01015994.1:103-423(+)
MHARARKCTYVSYMVFSICEVWFVVMGVHVLMCVCALLFVCLTALYARVGCARVGVHMTLVQPVASHVCVCVCMCVCVQTSFGLWFFFYTHTHHSLFCCLFVRFSV